MSPANRLDGQRLQSALAGQLIGNCVIMVEATTSTNDLVAELAAQSSEGLVVIAETQTAGRGQYGRRWDSTAGKGLWMSVLLRPAIAITDSAKLTDLLAQSIAGTIAGFTALVASVKPPNDVYVGARKIAGVLVDMRVEPAGNYCAICGMGVNVNHRLEDFPDTLRATAGSIASCLGREVDRSELAVALLRDLDGRYRAFSNNSALRAAS